MKIQKRTLTLCSAVVAAAIVAAASPALAQDTTAPATETAPAAPVKRIGRSSGDVGTGGLGVGGTMYVSGLAGPEVVYDFGAFHVDALFAFNTRPTPEPDGDRTTTIYFGFGGWYHLHLGESSDFSLGAHLAMDRVSPPMGNGATGFEFEPGAQIRAFVTPNVALHGGMAFVFEFGDESDVLQKQIGLGAGVTGNLGFTYYFR